MYAKADSSPGAAENKTVLISALAATVQKRILIRSDEVFLYCPRQNSSGTTSDLVTPLKSRLLGVRQPIDEGPMKLLRPFPLHTADRNGEPLSSLLSAASAITTKEEMLDLLKANKNLMVLWTRVRGYKFPKDRDTVKCQELGQYMSLMSECEVLYNSQSLLSMVPFIPQ